MTAPPRRPAAAWARLSRPDWSYDVNAQLRARGLEQHDSDLVALCDRAVTSSKARRAVVRLLQREALAIARVEAEHHADAHAALVLPW